MEITFTPINSVGQKCEGDLQGKSSACERRDSTIPSDLASGARSLHRQPLLDFAIQSTFSLSLLSALCHMTSFAPQLPSLNCLWASHFALSKKLPMAPILSKVSWRGNKVLYTGSQTPGQPRNRRCSSGRSRKSISFLLKRQD